MQFWIERWKYEILFAGCRLVNAEYRLRYDSKLIVMMGGAHNLAINLHGARKTADLPRNLRPRAWIPRSAIAFNLRCCLFKTCLVFLHGGEVQESVLKNHDLSFRWTDYWEASKKLNNSASDGNLCNENWKPKASNAAGTIMKPCCAQFNCSAFWAKDGLNWRRFSRRFCDTTFTNSE